MKTFTTATLSLATTLLLASSANAQSTYQIDPNSVNITTRNYWCQEEIAQCPLICLQTAGNTGTTTANTCDPNGLTYACICSNGMSPNVSQYTQTLPFFVCQEWGNQCVSNCGGDNNCASSCRQDHPCGAQNPYKPNTSTISTTMSATASGSGSAASNGGASTTGTIYSGFAGASSGAASGAAASASAGGASSVRVAALNMGQTFGLLGVAGALFGGFAILL